MSDILNNWSNSLIPDWYKQSIIKKLQSKQLEFRYLNTILRNNLDIALAAIQLEGINIIYVSESLLKNKKLITAAIQKDGNLLLFADSSLRSNKELALAAVKTSRLALSDVDPVLKQDKEVVLAAVKHDGNALEYAHENLRNDKEIVIAAVKSWGHSLLYASEDLKNDIDVVTAAAHYLPASLKYASDRLKYNSNILQENSINALDMLGKNDNWINIPPEILYTLIYESPDISLKVLDYYVMAAEEDGAINVNRQTVIWNICYDSLMNFILQHKDDIPVQQWPLIQKALIQNPEGILSPPPCIDALVEDVNDKYLMLAHYALGTNIINSADKIMLPEFDITI